MVKKRAVKTDINSAAAKLRRAEATGGSHTRPVPVDVPAKSASDPSSEEFTPANKGAKLCLNMIVKNEMANLERCLRSVADYVDCWMICDTGSTDGTQEFIREFFATRNIPGELASFPFHNFEQARNAGLDCAHASTLVYDYLLLADADMELVVDDRDFRRKLEAPCYDLLQRSGVSYWNPRLVRRDARARYHGVTHEYLTVAGGAERTQLRGVWYKDHASGSNRVDKFERDIRLLLEGLEKEPESHRYWFYLAQSYKDAGRTAEAIAAYAKRGAMGGWDEEAWYARLQEARCLLRQGDEPGFLRQALVAFNQRPQRIEPLYDLARFYRERGMYEASVLFSETALAVQPPASDVLFIEDFVYAEGLKEEYSIAANYSRDSTRKGFGFAACNWLALNRRTSSQTLALARSNLRFYVQPAKAIMPSFNSHAIGLVPPEGYHSMNPSVTRHRDQFVMVQRSSNFEVRDGRYVASDGGPIKTRNFLLRLDDDLRTLSVREILPPHDMPPLLSHRIQGFEDARLFSWRDALWFSACFRELNESARAEQVLVRIDESHASECRLADLRMLRPSGPEQPQKNWMPQLANDELRFVYLCDPTRLVDQYAQTVSENTPLIAAEHFRGGSQAIHFDGGWLSLTHEMEIGDNTRHYHHRFVWFDRSNKLCRLSRPFFFEHRGIEFAAGLCWHPGGVRLVVSYGVNDRKSQIATVDANDVRAVLEYADDLPTGAVDEPSVSVSSPMGDRSENGSEESKWFASLQEARRLRGLGDEGGLAQNALAAFDQRPHRAEPLYDLAKHYRERGMNAVGALFAEHGLGIPRPNPNELCVEDDVYESGLREEYSITANYARDRTRKDRGFAACNWLALNRRILEPRRNLARSNLKYYVQPARATMPSFASSAVRFTPPEGYRIMNPSVVRRGEDLLMVQRTVNYVITEQGGIQTTGDTFSTRNFLLRLTAALKVESSAEILPPDNLQQPPYRRVRGFEDVRPFIWRNALWCSAATRELAQDGWHQQVLARIDESADGCRFTDWRILTPPGSRQQEKNWMPFVIGDDLRFIYLCDPTRILDQDAKIVTETEPTIAAECFRGGSQAIAFDNGWLALVHEVVVEDRQRHYHHRFIYLDDAMTLRRVSKPFFFEHHGVEFAAGLALHPDEKLLVISYGIEDRDARVATVAIAEVRRSLDDVSTLSDTPVFAPSRAPHVMTVEAKSSTREMPAAGEGKVDPQLHFIVGVPRSGTTLFRAMLGAHPAICAPSETPWVTGAYSAGPSLRALLHSLVEAGDGPVKNIQDISKSDVSRAARLFVAGLFSTKMEHERKHVLVLKTPDDIWFVDELIEFFPDAKILHLRRDVRDVALSTVNAGFAFLKHFGVNNFANAVNRWVACETKIEEIKKSNANIHSFRFEDLLAHPKRELKRTARILGVSFHPSMLDYASHLLDAPAWEVGSRDVKRQPSLNAAKASAHRRFAPTAEQLKVIEERAADIKALGYSPTWELEVDAGPAEQRDRSALTDAGEPRASQESRNLFNAPSNTQSSLNISSVDPEIGGSRVAPSGTLTSRRSETTASAIPQNRLLTVHGTVVYLDLASGECRHGSTDHSPLNASLVVDGAHAQIVCENAETLYPIVCTQDRCLTLESANKHGGPFTPTILEVVALDEGTVALRAGGVFLCAEADGRVTLSRSACGAWEQFELETPAAGHAGLNGSSLTKSGRARFLQLAPFLRAADSPKKRRTLSREFDMRIAPFLDHGGAALPQIHCFYEVRSHTARHDSLIAATVSMHAAGHPVRVWSYETEKLAFLLPHGIDVRAADDVVPRELFERIVAGADIRYFSDLFRYAVLYEYGGLWSDTDVIFLRSFPFRGDYFFNLQWRSGSRNDHFICGNVMYAKAHSPHLRSLYEASIARFSASGGRTFGDVGPKLLSEYFASDVGAELQDWLFSPMLFNSIDWTELDQFNRPVSELGEYLNDERVFGVHLWNASSGTAAAPKDDSLLSFLTNPLGVSRPIDLADKFDTDKNRRSGNRHCYARVYDQLLSPRRFSMRRILEIGLCRGLAERNQTATPSIAFWQAFFPFCHVFGADVTDFSSLNNERFTSFICDQSERDELRTLAAKLDPGSLDLIIDDGSHASFDQQLTLRELLPLLADGGWYFIEDLDWQPPGENDGDITPTKYLLREIQRHGAAVSIDPLGISALSSQIADLLFFDSHYELERAKLLGGLVALRKRGGNNLT